MALRRFSLTMSNHFPVIRTREQLNETRKSLLTFVFASVLMLFALIFFLNVKKKLVQRSLLYSRVYVRVGSIVANDNVVISSFTAMHT